MIVADTGAVVALIDRDEQHHEKLRSIYEATAADWLLPWAILPEVDYLLATRINNKAARDFCADLADGSYRVEWGKPADLDRAEQIARRHRGLKLGLVDTVVMAVAERLRAKAIATLDLRHFGAVSIAGSPRLLPRDG